MATKTKHQLARNEYGALNLSALQIPPLVAEVKALLAEAIRLDTGIQAAYIDGSKREFECINHDIFDVLLFRGKVKALVVQQRWFWKDKRKGYTRATKEYFIVIRENRKVRVQELDSRTCAKRAKNSLELGDLVKHYTGKTVVACKAPSVVVETAYKVVAQAADGSLVSAFDGSLYKPGVWRAERAEEDHGGGFYCYRDSETAVRMTQSGGTFAASVSEGKSLVLCEVEISGRRVRYDSGKVAVSRLRIVRVIGPVEMPAADVEE